MAGSDDDARLGDRIPTVMRIRFKYADVDQFIEKFAVNISRGGVLIASKSPLPVGTPISLEFQLAQGSPLIRGEGEVAWVKPFDPAHPTRPHGMGVRFTHLDAQSRMVVDRALAWKESHKAGLRGPAIPPLDALPDESPAPRTESPTPQAAPPPPPKAGAGRAKPPPIPKLPPPRAAAPTPPLPEVRVAIPIAAAPPPAVPARAPTTTPPRRRLAPREPGLVPAPSLPPPRPAPAAATAEGDDPLAALGVTDAQLAATLARVRARIKDPITALADLERQLVEDAEARNEGRAPRLTPDTD